MDLTSTSLGTKEAVSSINNAFKSFVISSSHSGMGSKLLFRFRSGTHGLNEELGRHSSRNSSKACFFVSVSANL